MKIRHILLRAIQGIIVATLIILLVMVITGVPRPPSITTRHTHRVSWQSAIKVASTLRELGGVLHSDGWPTSDTELMIGRGSGRGGQRVVLSNPNDTGKRVEEIPTQVDWLVASPDTTHRLVAYLQDEGGSELYRVFTWRPGAQPTPLTATPERLELCCINNAGTLLAFTRNNKEDGLSDILIADPRDPNSVRVVVTKLKGAASAIEWAPDGKRLLVVQSLAFNSNRAMIYDAATNRLTQLAPAWTDPVSITGGAWSEDGSKLYLTSDAGSDFARPFEIDPTTGSIRSLIAEPQHDAIDIGHLKGSDKLVVSYDEDGRTKLYLLDPAHNSQQPLPAPEGDFEALRLHPRQPKFVEVAIQPNGQFAAYVIDTRSPSPQLWATGKAPSRTPVPSAQILSYPTFDSVDGKPRTINLLLKPPTAEFAQPWPVLINLHGGPALAWRPHWDPVDATLQRAGVAILEPNVRGSAGFGKQFQTLDDQDKREDAVRDVGALLDWIQKNPQLDASRVCVMGGSYGGYLSLATLTHYSNRLRCGIDMFGLADLAKFLEDSREEMFVDVQRAEYGDERDPKVRAYLDSISPINHAENITVPLMIFQGANDVRVKPEQSRQMVERLERLGRDVRYIEANNEGHGLDMPLNRLYFGASVVDFLNEFLVNAAPGSSTRH